MAKKLTPKKKSILLQAYEIIEERSEEKSREYGDFTPCMDKAAEIASILSNKKITTTDMFNCMIGLKMSRESHKHKEDNLLDLVAYIGALNNYKNETDEKQQSK